LRGRGEAGQGDAISVQPRSDPAADATLRRRLERQIQDAVGDRVRSVEVRVLDRNVVIRARVRSFLYRRGVRRALEGLPGISGYKTKIEVLD
jgi:hypothetical protein